jgi:hypothetical protein
MIHGLSGLRDVGGVGMAEIDVAVMAEIDVGIGAAKKTATLHCERFYYAQ